jgi:hypothetical protein
MGPPAIPGTGTYHPKSTYSNTAFRRSPNLKGSEPLLDLPKFLALLFDQQTLDFAAWEKELSRSRVTLTSSAWAGWYEEDF